MPLQSGRGFGFQQTRNRRLHPTALHPIALSSRIGISTPQVSRTRLATRQGFRAGRPLGAVRLRAARGPAATICITAVTLALGACSSFEFFVANAPVPFGSFRRATDLAYGSGPRQRLDVFSPQSGEHPVVVFLYGGSWTEGSKSQYAFVGAALAARGYVTVIPDYRLYPQVRFPELMADPANAVAWVRAHAREFGGDPDRIYLMGHSAGAYMAAMLALNGAYLRAAGVPPNAIAGLVGLSGPYVLVPNTESLDDIFASPYTTADWQPERFASSQAPPTLLLHGLEDRVVSPQQTRRLTETLASYHVEVDSECYPSAAMPTQSLRSPSWRASVLPRWSKLFPSWTALAPPESLRQRAPLPRPADSACRTSQSLRPQFSSRFRRQGLRQRVIGRNRNRNAVTRCKCGAGGLGE